jgi:NodT family efflux transporter outer membrane factor (OMF) lipoprotein
MPALPPLPLLPRWRLATALTLSAALLAACATPGERPAPQSLRAPATLGLPNAPTANVSTAWWTGFGDPQLGVLVDMALKDQPGLALSQARVAQAQALTGLSASATVPQVQLGAEATRQRFTERGLIPRPIAGEIYNSGTLQLGLGWSPDFFGQHAAELARALGQARAAEADHAAARLALAGQVSRAYVGLAHLLAQRELATRHLQQGQALLALVQQRVAAGLDTRIEDNQTQVALSDVQGQLETLDGLIVLARRQIAVLCGQAPDTLLTLSPRLQDLQLVQVPEQLGLDLLGRRPEVLASRWRVQAATQGVSEARSAFYPNINLTAYAGLNALGLDRVLALGAQQYGVTPALRLPLFDGGRLRAQLGGREAELDAAIALYNRSLLDAVKDAGDALASVQSLARQQAPQEQALASAASARRLTEERLRSGIGNAMGVILAELQVLAQQRQATDLRARQLDARMALMTALGGGWQNSPSPQP